MLKKKAKLMLIQNRIEHEKMISNAYSGGNGGAYKIRKIR